TGARVHHFEEPVLQAVVDRDTVTGRLALQIVLDRVNQSAALLLHRQTAVRDVEARMALLDDRPAAGRDQIDVNGRRPTPREDRLAGHHVAARSGVAEVRAGTGAGARASGGSRNTARLAPLTSA